MRLNLCLSSICLFAAASALQAGVALSGEYPLYSMTFFTPFQNDGDPVALDTKGVPRRGPSSTLGATPQIELIQQGFSEQQMAIEPDAGSATFVVMDLTDLNPIDPNDLVFNRYNAAVTFEVDGLAATANEIEIQFEGANEFETTWLEIRSDGSIFYSAGENAGFVGTDAAIDENQTYRIDVTFDLNLGLFSVFFGQDEIVRDEFTPLTALTAMNIVPVRAGQPTLTMDVRGVYIDGFDDDFEHPDLDPTESHCTGDPVLDAPLNQVDLYDVDFNSPANEVGEFPVHDFGATPRNGVTHRTGDALIVGESGSNTDNSLALLGRGDSITTSHSRVRFDTSSTTEGGLSDCYERYIVEFDLTVLDIGDSSDSFAVRGVGGTTNSLVFASNGRIVVSTETGVQTVSEILDEEWRRGRRESWKIEYDIEMLKWRVFHGAALVYTADIDMDYLTWIEFDLLDVGQADSGVFVDDIIIGAREGFTPGPNDLNEDGAVDARDIAFGLQQELLDVDGLRDLLEENGFEVDDYTTLKKWKKPVNKFYSKEVVPRFTGQRPSNLKKQDKKMLEDVWLEEQPSLDDITDTGLPDANDDGDVDEQDMALVLEKGNIADTARALAILDAMGYTPADFGSEKKWKKKMNKVYKKQIQKQFFEKRSKADKNFDKAYLAALY